ncbi:hypothetical protein TSAR_007386 [Trichomalopsis sarcophagae]|uniref:Uncharacterized protein n=1 Tax=Trichomalopsis sarcophagae TaxID=543379 RepID=A0A232EYP8_9HYME|nr:hypothetical protein TSAR_007386 [Trichomalopsis sarcophagae]
MSNSSSSKSSSVSEIDPKVLSKLLHKLINKTSRKKADRISRMNSSASGTSTSDKVSTKHTSSTNEKGGPPRSLALRLLTYCTTLRHDIPYTGKPALLQKDSMVPASSALIFSHVGKNFSKH